MKCRAWGQERVRISLIAGVRDSGSLFQSLRVSPGVGGLGGGGLALVCISGVSVIAKCPQGESRLYIVQ